MVAFDIEQFSWKKALDSAIRKHQSNVTIHEKIGRGTKAMESKEALRIAKEKRKEIFG